MARDEALARCTTTSGIPTLRLYRFDPPAITLGRFQEFPGGIQTGDCQRYGIDLVRRPTGGLAILHHLDFTYSVTLPRDRRMPAERKRYFNTVAAGILGSLELIGVKAELVDHRGPGRTVPTWCFDGVTGIDVEWEGRKICGSAQRMFESSVLQHGSLFLDIDQKMLKRMTRGDETKGISPVTIKEVTERDVGWKELKSAFKNGFAESLGLYIEQGELSEDEACLAERMRVEKYSNFEWLWKGLDTFRY